MNDLKQILLGHLGFRSTKSELCTTHYSIVLVDPLPRFTRYFQGFDLEPWSVHLVVGDGCC